MNTLTKFAFTTLFCVFHAITSPARAAELPSFDQQVSITVREQPVQHFLKTLFTQIGVPVVISEDIEGLMNGKFEGSARKVLDNVMEAFTITLYFDGAVAHIYSANEITRTMMPVSSDTAERVEKIASRMKIGDSHNRVDSSDGGGLMVTGTRRYLEQIEEISFSVQANAKNKQAAPVVYRVFYLSNAWAADTNFDVGNQSVTVSGVASLLKELVFDGRLPVSVVENMPSRPGHTLEGLRGRGLQAVSVNVSESTNSKVSAPTVSPSGQAPFESGPRIVADSRLNAIIISDTADRMPAYQELIADLDKPSRMVEIEATIIDINTDKTRELGVGWQYRQSGSELSLIGNTGGDNSEIAAAGLIQGPGAILSTILGGRDQFLARIQALEEMGAARVVSKPHVITLSDVEAVLGSTTEFFVRVAGAEEVDLFNVPVGTTLRVTPHVFQANGQSHIKLLVNIEDGTASSQLVDQIPVVERAKINTQAVINEGDSLLIGGLVRDSYQQMASSVPFLGRIPVLGRLFKSTANKSSRVERLFMITPRTADGLGFGRVHNGRQLLPMLQGDSVDIEQQAAGRMMSADQPFGHEVDDIPFKPFQLPRDVGFQDVPGLPSSSRPAGQVIAENDKPDMPKWSAETESELFIEIETIEPRSVSNNEWTSIPVVFPAAMHAVAKTLRAESDGWVAIK